MKERHEPYTKFMMTTRHHDMDSNLHFVPALATESSEIDRLHVLPHGTKILESQHRGAAVMSETLKLLLLDGDPKAIAYFQKISSPAIVNSLGYLVQGNSDTMNKQVDLPYVFNSETGRPITAEQAAARTLGAIEQAEQATADLLHGHTINHLPKYKVNKAARDLGNGALWLATMDLPAQMPAAAGAYDAQLRIRERSLNTVQIARNIGKVIHMIPSLGAAGDIDSTYSAFMRRNVPSTKARNYIAQAQEAYALAA